MEGEKKYIPRRHVAFRKISDKMVIVHPIENRLITINETGWAIWEMLDGRKTKEIVDEIVDMFEVSKTKAQTDVNQFLLTLVEKNLIELLEDGQ